MEPAAPPCSNGVISQGSIKMQRRLSSALSMVNVVCQSHLEQVQGDVLDTALAQVDGVRMVVVGFCQSGQCHTRQVPAQALASTGACGFS